MSKTKYYIFILLCCFVYTVNGQNIIDYRQLTPDDGLSERVVHHINRDSFGYFYLVTELKIEQFDGQNFIPLDIGLLHDHKIKATNIKRMYKAPDGKLLLRADPTDKVFYIEPGSTEVFAKPVDQKMEVIVSNNLLYGIIPKDSHYDIYSLKPDTYQTDKKLFTSKDVPENIVIDNEAYLVQGFDDKITTIDGDKSYLLPESGKIIQVDTSIILASKGTILSYKKKTFTPIYMIPNQEMTCKFIRSDDEGNIILPYGNLPRFIDGLFVVSPDYTVKSLDSILTFNKLFRDIYADDINHMIIHGGFSSLFVFNIARDGFTTFDQTDMSGRTFGFVVSGIAVDHEDNLFYLKESNEIFKIEEGSNESYPILEDYVDKGFFNRNGKLYYNSYNDKLYSHSYTYQNQSELHETDPKLEKVEKILIPFKVNDILLLDENILIGGYEENTEVGVVAIYSLKEKTVKKRFDVHSRVYSFYYQAKLEEYWVGTKDGLLVFNKEFEEIHRFDRFQDESDHYLQYDYIRTLKSYKDHIVAGTIGGGIYVIDPVTYSIIKNISDTEGLTDNKAIGIVNDDYGHCWVSTWNGLNVLDSGYSLIRTYYEHDGIPHREFNTNAVDRDSKGNLYFGTINGLLKVDPRKVLNWKESKGMHIDRVGLHRGVNVEYVSKVNATNTFDSIVMEISYPDYFVYPFEKTKPHISSQGFIKSLDIGSSKITLKDFLPGQYDLNIGIPRSTFDQNISFVISKSYAALFKYLLIIGLICLLSLLVILRNKKIEKEKTAINKRISELQLSALQAQMNPHFLFNALGAIQYFIQTHNIEKADEYLSDFAMLMRRILESSKSKFISINNEMKLLDLYISLEQIRYEKSFDYEVEIDQEIDQEFRIPPMVLQPYIENAINHGIFSLKNKRGKLSIAINKLSENAIKILLTDNGIGRTKAALLRSKDHKSRGMQIVKERIDTFNNTDLLHAKIDIIDLHDNQGDALGTQVVLIFTDKDL